MLACAQITIRQAQDWEISTTAPANPTPDTLWLDTSVSPHVMKRWTGNAWVPVGVNAGDVYLRTEVDTRFTQTDQAISLKANETTVSALASRVTSAEQKITPTAIVSTVRSSTEYRSDRYTGRNYVPQSHQVHTFVNSTYRYADGSPSTYTGWSLAISPDLFEHSGYGASLRISFEVKRTNVDAAASAGIYSGVWMYYRYYGADGTTIITTGRGWYLRTTDTDFTSTDQDWVRIVKGPLNLAQYNPISLAYFMYGTSASSGTTGTVQFRNLKVEVGDAFTDWSAAPEDLNSLPGRLSTAETSIQQNANNIALKVNTSTYNMEKVYRGTVAPASPTANMLWLDLSISPSLLKRYTGSAWVAAGAETLKTSGIYIGPDSVSITTEQFLLQLLDANNNENVLMEMSANGNVGFKELFAERIISDSVAKAYSGPNILYVHPAHPPGGTVNFPSLGEAVKVINNKYLYDDVQIILPNGIPEIYEAAGIHLRGIAGPGRLVILGYANCMLNSYMTIRGCQTRIEIVQVNLREIRGLQPGGGRNGYLIECHGNHYVWIASCVLNANGTTYDAVFGWGSSIALYNCALYNAVQGLEVANQCVASIRYCMGSCTYAVAVYSSILMAHGTVPAGTRLTGENGQLFANGVTTDYGAASNPVSPDSTTTQYATLTRSYRGGWRADTLDVVQGVYSDYGYSSGLSWNYGCMWFGNLRSTLSGRTIKSATLTLYRLTGSGSGSEKTVYLWAISNTGASGAPVLTASFGALGTIGRGKQVSFSIPTSAVQGLANGSYGGLCLYESPYPFGTSTYSDCYMRMGGTDSSAPYLSVVYN